MTMEKKLPYRISTITANGDIGSHVDLDIFFENIRLVEPGTRGFVWASYKGRKGVHPKTGSSTNGVERKNFDNQATVVYYIAPSYSPNIKLFRNGNIQMTGVKRPEDGEWMIQEVAKELSAIARNHPSVLKTPETLLPQRFKIRMINSDFALDYRVRRKELHQIMMDEYDLITSYDPSSYPAAKCIYFWNQKNTTQGTCSCGRPCYGSGDGNGDGDCKKVTISVFQSGKILITGATSYQQIDDAYEFINGILAKHKEKIQWRLPIL